MSSDKDNLPFYLRPAALALLVLALTTMKLWSASQAYFVEDEAYYRLWGLSPAAAYYDHPPMIGWWIWIGQQLFGDTIFGVRALVVVSSVLGALVLWRTAAVLFDERVAGWAVLFFNASILVGVGGILATPDAPSVFFWGLSLWALAELNASGKANWWLAIGLFAGLGLASKYSVLFLGAGIVVWLFWVPQSRRWLGSWQLWVGGLIALLCFAPVLYWNYLHDWASFHKQFGRAGRGDWTGKYIFEFIGSLLGLLNPLIAVPAVLGGVRLSRTTWHKDSSSGLLILTILPFLTYLLYHSLHARVQANWPAPLFPVLALVAAVFVADPKNRERFWRRWSLIAIALGIGVAVLVQIHAVKPFTGALGRKDPTFQLRGWQEIGREIKRLANETGAAYVATTAYGLNGQLAFLMKNDVPVFQLNERIRYVNFPIPDTSLFARPGLYIAIERRDRSVEVAAKFADVTKIAALTRTVDGTDLENILVYEISQPFEDPFEPDPVLQTD